MFAGLLQVFRRYYLHRYLNLLLKAFQEHIHQENQRNKKKEGEVAHKPFQRTLSVKWQQPVAPRPPLRQQQFSSPEAGERAKAVITVYHWY